MAEPAWNQPDRYQAYEDALVTALDDLGRAQSDAEEAKNYLRKVEARISELGTLVRHLISELPPDRRARFAKQLADFRLTPSEERSTGPVYNNVIDLFTRETRREWTASEVQIALAESGVHADPKAVYNVLNYLARKGRLQRIGRGHYLVKDLGVSFHLDQDIEGTDPNEGGCM